MHGTAFSLCPKAVSWKCTNPTGLYFPKCSSVCLHRTATAKLPDLLMYSHARFSLSFSTCNYYFTDFSSPIPLVVKESTYMHIRRYLYLCTHHIYDTYKYSFSCTCIQTHTYCECIPIPYLISRAIYLLIVQILCCWQFEWNILPKIRSQWQSHKTLLFWSPEGRKEKR